MITKGLANKFIIDIPRRMRKLEQQTKGEKVATETERRPFPFEFLCCRKTMEIFFGFTGFTLNFWSGFKEQPTLQSGILAK